MSEFGVVTGAAGALGRAVVDEFGQRGVPLVAVVHSAEAAARLSRAHPSALDVEVADLADPDAVAALWQRLDARDGSPSFLVNAVGGYRGGRLVDSAPDDYRHLLGLNLDTAWWSSREAARRMQDAGGGSIVNVAARPAVEGGSGSAAYAVSKAAVVKLTQVLAAEMKPAGVRVNAILPAVIDTPDNRAVMPPDRIARAVPPDAIAKVIAFLCGPDAWPISGAIIPVYGRF